MESNANLFGPFFLLLLLILHLRPPTPPDPQPPPPSPRPPTCACPTQGPAAARPFGGNQVDQKAHILSLINTSQVLTRTWSPPPIE